MYTCKAGISWIELLILYKLGGGIPLTSASLSSCSACLSLKQDIVKFHLMMNLLVRFFRFWFWSTVFCLHPPTPHRRLSSCGFTNHTAKLNFLVSLKYAQEWRDLAARLLSLMGHKVTTNTHFLATSAQLKVTSFCSPCNCQMQPAHSYFPAPLRPKVISSLRVALTSPFRVSKLGSCLLPFIFHVLFVATQKPPRT
jgi:hypothetical protein